MTNQPHLVPGAPHGGVDASALPEHAFGPASPPWWGTVAFMVIEGFSLLVCIAAYLYLRRNFESYPPPGVPNPGLVAASVNLVMMTFSLFVARRMDRCARAKDSQGIIRYGAALLMVGAAILVLRGFELNALNVRWDSNAYGSAVWFVIGFHTLLLIIDFVESIAIWVIFVRSKEEEKHYMDAADDILYWYFVVGSWFVVFSVIFLGPRIL